MKIETFALERYFAAHEFSARYLLSCSDCEALSMSRVLELADETTVSIWNELKLGYTESQGHPALREAIAGMYQGLSADHILVAAPEEAIFILMQALLEPGDHVVCTHPGYQSLFSLAQAIGCRVSFWTPDEKKGWAFSLDRLSDLVTDETKLVVANFPHNPTGFVPSPAEYAAMVDLVAEKNIRLFSDEMYRFLEHGNTPTLASACTLYPRAVSLFGLSKTFGLPGLRIGWLATRDSEILEKAGRMKDYTTICNSAPSEILALMAVLGRDAIIARQKKLLEKNLAVLDDFMNQYGAWFSLNRPKGGSVCFPKMPATKDTGVFCRRLLKETGIMLAPSHLFQYGSRHVRMGFGREDFEENLHRLARYLDSLP